MPLLLAAAAAVRRRRGSGCFARPAPFSNVSRRAEASGRREASAFDKRAQIDPDEVSVDPAAEAAIRAGNDVLTRRCAECGRRRAAGVRQGWQRGTACPMTSIPSASPLLEWGDYPTGRSRSPNQADAARFCRPDAGHSAIPFDQEICRDARVRVTRRRSKGDSNHRSRVRPGMCFSTEAGPHQSTAARY